MNVGGNSEPEVVALDDDAIMDAVEELAAELEAFAFERERVLAKLDIRAAAHARRTARELRLVAATVALASAPAERDERLRLLGELLGRAHTLLEGERHEAPGRPAAGDPPLPPRRAAKSTPAPISDVRETAHDDFDLDYEQLGATLPGDAVENPELLAILRGTHPNQRPTAQALPAVDPAAVRDALAEPRALPFLGADEGENDFDDETVAKKVAWERSGNRVLGR